MKPTLRIYWAKELRGLLRDRNIVVYGLLLPLFLYPLLLFALSELRALTAGMRERMEPAIAIAELPELETRLHEVVPPPRTFPLTSGAGETLASGVADLVITRSNGNGRLIISHDSSSGPSRIALERFAPVIEKWRRQAESTALARATGWVERHEPMFVDTSEQTDSTRILLATLLPLILIIMCTFGATWPAIELTAGERERSTAETTFLLPLTRQDVALGKTLAVTSAAFVTLCVHLFAMLVAAGPLISQVRGGSASIPSLAWQSLPLVLCFGLLLSLVFGTLFMLAGSYAKTFREAQAFVTPLQLLMMLPAILTLLPSASLDATTAWIPIFNAGLAFRAALLGDIDVQATATTLLSLSLCGLLCFRTTVRRLSNTSFALGFADSDGLREKWS
ncbi:MAG: ABC transporter permease [Planctomycetes bacterium]|nr:ABC transporter permease [Planctomycetota bacterium]MCB9919246.1 ABC transporter permease [Planctomycetota bacterium]